LVLNGIDATKITILTFYNGQRKEIGHKIRAHPNLPNHGIQVVTVDSYQGEENDIVLLSLVRSNRNHAIGFLSSDNRACVALSRAKRGFYIFGNAELLACESGTWASVVNIMFKNKKAPVATGQERRVGYQFPLECVNHGRKMWCEEPEDFEMIKGGCDTKCEGVLPCGHRCPYMCHPFEHERINCTQKCSRRVEACGHPCVGTYLPYLRRNITLKALGAKNIHNADFRTAECCDPCKCHMCELRSNGVKSMLKPAPNGSALFRAPRNSTRSLILEDTLPVPSSRTTYTSTPRTKTPGSDSTTEQWEAYANGGVKEDDARVCALRKEEEARYLEQLRASTPAAGPSSFATNKLIQISPEKAAASRNTDLLVDIDVEPPSRSYATAVSSTVGRGAYTNLLD
jgi:helicase required for RNAi-mediated heterochromatin assembly 1